MANSRYLLSSNWAYDLSKNAISEGELRDVDVINQSIELILTTSYGERSFNLNFGSGLPRKLFESMSPSLAEDILNDAAAALKRWETRITVIESQMRVISSSDQNSVILVIPYFINSINISSVFQKKIVIS
jgi:phage baseplate assembly protein W